MKKGKLKKSISLLLVFSLISVFSLFALPTYAVTYTVATNTINTNAALAALGTSLLAGRNPISEMSYYGIDQLNTPGYGDPAYTTDGDVETQPNCVIYNAFHYYDPNPIGYPQRGTLVFDCQQSSIIDKIFLSFRDGTKMAKYQILISDNEYGDIFTSAQVVIDYENTTGNQLFTLTTPVVGRYIIIKGIDSDAPYFYEFAAYGSAAGSHDSIKTQLTQGQVDALGNAINKNSIPYKVFDYNGNVGIPGDSEIKMTDGNLTTRSFYSPMYYNSAIANSGSITYDLGVGAQIQKVLIGTDNLSGLPISSYEIYLGADYATLYTEPNKILAYDNLYSTTNQLFGFGTAKTGRYFGIRIIDPSTGSDTYARVHELSVYGTAGIIPLQTGISQAQVSALGTSLISGDVPSKVINWYEHIDPAAGDNVLYMTDGNISTRAYYSAMYYNGSRIDSGTITYDIGPGARTNKILIAGSDPTNAFGKYELYIGELPGADLYVPGNLVAEYENINLSTNQLFQFTEKYGRYFGIRILAPSTNPTDYMARVHEIGIYGTMGVVTQNYLDLNLTQAQVNALGTSLIAGDIPSKVINWYEHIDPVPGEGVLSMTDGLISTRAYYPGMYYNGTRIDSGTITYEIGPGATTSKILIANDSGGYALKQYEIYIADTAGPELYAPQNKVADYLNNNSSTVQLIHLAQPKYGRYFGIKIIIPALQPSDTMARIHELAVYGTIGTPTMDYMDYGLSQAQVNALGTSIISATAPLAVINTYNQNPSAGENVLNMTDGNISSRDYYGAMFFNGSEANSGTITYDLGVDATINKVLVASDPGGNAFKEYELYVADVSGADLFALSNRVSAYVNSNSSSVQLTSFAQSKTGRYFGIRLIVPSLNTVDKMARIYEIGLYGLTGVIQLKNFKINADIISGITPGTTVLAFKTALNLRSDVTVELKKGLTVLTNSDLIGSATTMNVYINSVLSKTYTQLIYGDATGDGNIDVADLAVMKLHLLKSSELTGILKKAGSLTNSDKITISDLIAVKKHMLGILSISQNR